MDLAGSLASGAQCCRHSNVNDGQMGEEDVHGAVESGVSTDYSKDDPIPHQGNSIE